jgi:hypothetical protein
MSLEGLGSVEKKRKRRARGVEGCRTQSATDVPVAPGNAVEGTRVAAVRQDFEAAPPLDHRSPIGIERRRPRRKLTIDIKDTYHGTQNR